MTIANRTSKIENPPTLGIIAGEGIFPFLVARGAKRAGLKTVAVALKGSAWPDLREEVDVFHPVGVTRLGSWVSALRKHRCDEAIMVGRVRKAQLYQRWALVQYIPDLRTLSLFIKQIRRDKRDQTLLQSVANELAAEGFPLSDSTKYCPEHLATPGVMTKRQPTDQQWADIRFGYELCTSLSKMQIGQAIAIADQNVLAVEALEGTDRMIERAGSLCRKGNWTLIKVANTNADMRIDVPSVGMTTIEKLKAAGAGCLVLTPGKTIILEKQKVLELADRFKIAVVGYESSVTPST